MSPYSRPWCQQTLCKQTKNTLKIYFKKSHLGRRHNLLAFSKAMSQIQRVIYFTLLGSGQEWPSGSRLFTGGRRCKINWMRARAQSLRETEVRTPQEESQKHSCYIFLVRQGGKRKKEQRDWLHYIVSSIDINFPNWGEEIIKQDKLKQRD